MFRCKSDNISNGQVRRSVPLGLRLRLGHEPARFGHVLLLLRDQALPLRDQALVLRDEALGLRVLGGRLLPWKRKAIYAGMKIQVLSIDKSPLRNHDGRARRAP